MPSRHTALGLRIKSGWAMAVLVAGPARSPTVLDRRRVELSDPARPRTRQPYHAGFGTAQTSQAVIARLARVIERCAARSLAVLVREYGRRGVRPRAAGLVVGSLIDPNRIANPHIRAHALEGALFRRVAVEGLAGLRIGSTVVVEREVYGAAARASRITERQLRGRVAELAGQVSGRWRSEEKTAAAVACLALASRRR
ncbi:MAG TPA: hypothetical protein VKB63_11770 [Gemmatimonadales bacterium]|nr:hypothetical protein [Gemmatimonadales bacterium]